MLLSAASNEYRGKASKMRESNSVRDKMIDRNWVKKRKRKRIPCGLDLSKGKEGISPPLESPRNNSSAKRRLKGDFSISRSAPKKKGNDGYYFECVICDLGGNLLCCDSCPRTYHLQCLNPPLKRTPPGKWQCPNCCDSKGSVKPINHPDTISRRARTKTTVEKSKTRDKSSCSEKLSFIIRRSIPGKNRSSSKGKPASSCTVPSVEKKLDSPKMGTSCIVMPSHSPDGRCTDGISTCADTSVKKKINSSCINASIDRKSSSHEEVQTSDGILESDPKDELSEVKSDLHCSNPSPEKKLTPVPDPSEKSRKRKQKIKKEDNKKKPKSEKGKWIVSTTSKHASKVAAQHPETSKHRKKRSSVDKRISLSISKEDATNRIGSSREQDEGAEETLQTSHGLDDPAGKDKATREESTQDGVQQVDRILGCRVQSCDVVSPSIKFVSSPAHTEPESHSVEPVSPRNSLVLLDQRNHDKPSEDNPARIKAIDMNTGKFLGEGGHITTKQVGDTEVDDVHMNRTLLSKDSVREGDVTASTAETMENEGLTTVKSKTQEEPISSKVNTEDSVREGDVTASTAETMENQGLTTVKSKTQEEPISSKVNTEEVDVKEVYEENANVELVDLDIPCSSAVSECNARIVDDKLLITKLNESAKMNSTDKLPKESVPMNREDVIYEFLVKWVGKSHIRNSWVSESQLKILAKRKLENYKAKYGTALINICQEQWSQPQRVIALRGSKDGAAEVLVKWRGLPYDECTWERLDEPIIEESTHLIADFKKLECQAFEKNVLWDDILRTKGDSHQSEIATLMEQPEELKGGSLFPHQLEALNWLRKCWSKSKNVILADEMGLGKTVSACAFLSSLYFEFKVGIPSLVLVPLSTMPNWLAEFALWAPDLNVVEYHGSAKARSVIRQYEWHASVPDEMAKKTLSYKFHVLLTTYEMVLADSSHLRGVPWEVLVVDEGHRLKNSGSKLFSLLNTFSFQHRVLLTGTPLQNNIGEMYNLLNFLQPTSFPSLSSFEEKFNDLTTAEKVEELKKLVAPHMLRRLKKDAMQNIPPKTERMVPVELSSIQAEYYRAMLTKNYQILRNIGKGVAQQSMLNIVMQLRKVCNHPYLIPGTEPESGSVEFLQEMRIKASAKLTLLHSMLKSLKKEGHRVLIFSQMTKLLDILEDYLTVEFGPKTFERVDGSVSVADRQAAIARFNQDKTRFVFLLSTRSCGLGINLATADTVIIYDSDFNPHADIQAMNRAHRIGQSKRLLVYRLVVRASVEERILQLAKKKLMLDQLFVNKSESQKDVEDILRWGTEELFSGCAMTGNDTNENASSKTEVASETESRQKRRAGGLGDVYKDRCTDGNTMIVWDENAILRLLDRSNLQSGYNECTEGELESDMLGSVKSVEWNDEPNEEPGSAELPPTAAADVGVQSSEKKEDHAINGTEENEWDRLLRLRWEKYKSEEAAALGRGKRLRKAVSYKEVFAPHPSEALSETGNDDEPEPEQEQEPEPEYTPAGRALKTKYAKLRARQKERLAQRYIREGSRSVEDNVGLELPTKFPNAVNREIGASLGGKDPTSAVSLEGNKLTQLSDEPKDKMGSITKLGRLPKYGYKSVQSSDLDLSVRPPGSLTPVMFLPSHQPQATCMGNSMPASNLLPVLGLCAPNANHVNSARNFKSYMNLSKSHLEHSRIGMGVSDFPFQLAPNASTSIDEDLEARETTADGSALPDTSAGALHRGLKNNIKQSNFPFNPFPSTSSPEIYPDPLESSGNGLSASQGKLVLPNLALDEKSPAKLPLPSTNMSKSHPDFLPSLSLGMKGEGANVSGHDLLTMPLLPNFRQQMNDNLKQNQQASEVSPILGPNQTQGTYSSLPEKHKKVLENIMMRTGSGTSNSSKKRSRVDVWSEDELDALWIGVRRHGWGNWHVMLRDSKLKFSKYRTIEDLSEKWEEEQLKILGGPSFPVPKSTKTTTFPLISDGMMTRALLGSKLAGRGAEQLPPPKFHSHLTDIQLGYGDLTSSLSHMDPIDPFYLKNDHSSMPVWKHDKLMPNLAGDYHAGPSTRSADLNLLLEQPFLPNSMAGGSLGSLSMNHSGSSNLKEKEEEQYTNKYLKLPSLLDKSLNWLRDSHNNRRGSDSGTKLLPDPTGRLNSDRSSPNDDVAGSSSTGNKLPHWLREAVSAPPKQPEPDLPPTVSAIAHSVRLLYGEEKPTIPPFTVPGPPPFQPKDPRRSLRKRRRLHKLRRLAPDVAFTKSFQSNLLGNNNASSSIPPAPPFPSLPPSTGVFPWIEPNLSLSSLPSSSFLPNRKKGTTMSPSPEVLHLVASCVAPGPHMSPAPAIPGSSFIQAELPPTKAFEPYETVTEGGNSDVKGARGKRKPRRGSLLGNWGHLPEERVEHTLESGDSSKTQSDPHRIDRPEVEEISSEETVSDDRGSEHE